MFEYQPPANLLQDRTILVTGAGSGIGKVMAKAFARHGATVILCGRNKAKLEQAYDAIEAQNPGRALIHPLDLLTATEDDYRLLAASIESEIGQLDGLLHNAALLGARSPLEHYPTRDWYDVMQVNVNAAFHLTRCTLPLLSRARDARILFTASSVGRRGRAYWGAYSVSKFAVEGLMQVLAEELENTSKIRVNSLNPGATRTDMRKQAYPAEDPAGVPAPESLEPVYLYLMGADSSHLHGRALDATSLQP